MLGWGLLTCVSYTAEDVIYPLILNTPLQKNGKSLLDTHIFHSPSLLDPPFIHVYLGFPPTRSISTK